MTITLRSWIAENELTLDSPVCDEILDADGHCYGSPDGTEYWVNPLLVVQTDTTGTRPLSEDAEQNFRDWLDLDGNRPHDLSKPNEVIYG